MLASKSEKFSAFEQEMVITREEKISRMRKKSQTIENFQAGYLNSAAERKARIRSFFFPGQYQANSPSEKLDKMRSMSQKIAKYEGAIKRREYERKMHPSARHLGRFSLYAMGDREEFRAKLTKRMAKIRKVDLPAYLRESVKKPRYDKKTEKGLWAE